jgi:MoxR-like ATPase
MKNTFISLTAFGPVHLPAIGGMPASVHVIDDESIDAINAALATARPLLVRGEPGTGKSQLARAAAVLLGRAFLSHAVDARTETRDLLWTLDAVARLATAQVMSALHKVDHDEVMRRIDVVEFIQPGPLWWAFDWASAREQARRARTSEPLTPEGWTADAGAVVLVDEIDKADASVPNGLLDALGHGRFDVQGRAPVAMNAARLPLVVITTNEERSMPDAFLRRCLVLHLGLPEDRSALVETLIVRGRAHFKDAAESVLRKAAEQLADDRDEHKKRDLAPPGLAEYIDLVRAITEQRPDDEKLQLDLLKRISKFMFGKHPKEQMR